MLTNSEIASQFEETAEILEILNENTYRIRAYRIAARTLMNCSQDISKMSQNEKSLTELPGIGKDLAQKIISIVKSGSFSLLDELHMKVPLELRMLLKIPGLGPKRVSILKKELNIHNIDDLKKALAEKKVRKIDGFGIKSEEKLSHEVSSFQKTEKRMNFWEAEMISKPIIEYLKTIREINQVVIAGSFRRKKETVGDLDILVSILESDRIKVHEKILNYPQIESLISKGSTRVSFYIKTHFQIDIRIIEENSFGAALQYFTGSKEHNIAIRRIAENKHLLINEYGVFRNEKAIAGKTEIEVYQAIGFPFIEPELRENRGEIEAALKNKLPLLVSSNDIKGDLHVHTDASDGQDELGKICIVYQTKGYEYIAITDHSKSQKIAKGLSEQKLFEQIKRIDKLNERLSPFRILKSCEIDILEDGSLDFKNSILKELDLRICSIHSQFHLSKQKQTDRIIKAMDNRYFNIFAHPTGRLLRKRQPYEIDMEKIMHAAKERGCVLELNSQYVRLDLNDIHCKMAKEMGLKISIATDSHSINDIAFLSFGIAQARRGWLEAEDVINTYPLEKLLKCLHRI